jgi:hypothetical protein
MKTMKKYTIALWLLIFTFSLPAQNHVPVSGKHSNDVSAGFRGVMTCQSLFSAIPDSLSSFPFYYHFKDLSAGNINSWYWDFGDGSHSTEQNPSHQYNDGGTYHVCLSVADLTDPDNCSDQSCQDIITLEYFSLGGLVYAGEYPLNNPVMAGDTGIASLYRIVNQQIVFVEDHYFQDYGYYWFGYLFPGEYIIKVGLTPGSTHSDDYFTTYFGDNISWTKANLLSISTASLYAAEIHLIPVQPLATGQGIIRGYVNFEQDIEFSMPPISQTTVILSDIDHKPLQFTHPNPAGYFEITGVPYGSYFLTADATGKPSSTVSISLTESSPIEDGINLTVFGSNQNFIPEGTDNSVSLNRVYPDPVKDNLHIKVYSGISSPVDIRVIDVTGKCFYQHAEKIEPGYSQVIIPAADLPSGIYLLILQPQGIRLPVTAKFIK